MEVIAEGKTKEVLVFPGGIAPNIVKIRSKPDITAGNGAKKDIIPGKGKLANNTTCNVFELLGKEGIVTHFISRTKEEDAFWAHECEMIPIEFVARRIATGSYTQRNPNVKEGTVFTDFPVVEFFLKDDERHDPIIVISEDGTWDLHEAKKPIGPESFIEETVPLLDKKDAVSLEGETRFVFEILEESFKQLGITLWDFKIEFGRRKDNHKLVIADVIDSDSWRIRTGKGEQLDKQIYRDGAGLEEVKNVFQVVSELTDLLPCL